MPKSDDKGEPVKTVTIGGREVEVPIIFILPEESGEKEIERYEHPKVHIKKEDKAAESKEEPLEELTDGKLEEVEKPSDEEETPYLDMLSDKPKKKKKPVKVSYRSLFDKGYGKAQALRRSVEEQKKRGAKTDDELAAEKEKEIPKGQKGFLNYNYLHNQPDIEDKKDYLTDEEGDEIEKSWERWLKQKDALDASENTGEFKRWGDKPHQQAGRDPKTGKERFDYYESNAPYGFGGLGKKEPQTRRGQSDDATQERGLYGYGAKDPRTEGEYPVKKPARESGENTSRGDSKISQHKYRTFEVPSSGNSWAYGHKVPKEMWDQEPVSELGKEDFEDGKLDYHKIREVPRGGKAPTEGTDTPSREELKRRNALLPKTGKSPKGTKVRKKAWEKWMVRL